MAETPKQICQICQKDHAAHTIAFADREALLCCDCVEALLTKFAHVPFNTVYQKDKPIPQA